jgi:hypothetical protein
MEAMGGDPPPHAEMPGGPPQDGQHAATRRGVLAGELELDDQVGAGRPFVLEEATQQGGRDPERDVPDDTERALRQCRFERIAAMHEEVRRSPAGTDESLRQDGVHLDRHHDVGDLHELTREASRSGADLNDELVASDVEAADQLSREARTEVVPTS